MSGESKTPKTQSEPEIGDAVLVNEKEQTGPSDADRQPSLAALYQALVTFQEGMPSVKRGAVGQQGHRTFRYAEFDSIRETAQPFLAKAGLAVIQPLSTVPDTEASVIDTIVIHTSGASLSTRLLVPIGQKDAQQVGSVVTSYRRYAYCAALGITIEGEDDGDVKTPTRASQTASAPRSAASDTRPATDKQRVLIARMAQGLGYGPQAIEGRLAKVSTAASASQLIDDLKREQEERARSDAAA